MLISRRSSTFMMLAVMALACRPADDPEQDDDDGGGNDDPEPPAILEPINGEFQVPITHADDRTLSVADVHPGTMVLIDGEAVGDLHPQTEIGHLSLDDEHLLLRMDGSMTAFTHSLRLGDLDGKTPLFSNEVIVIVTPERRQFEVVFAPAEEITGAALSTHGQGNACLLAVLQTEASSQISIHRAVEGAWTLDDPRTIELPQLWLADTESTPRAPMLTLTLDPDGGIVRVAWLAATRDRIDVRELHWDDDEVGPVYTAMTADVDDFPQAEWAELGRPAWVGHDLVAELGVYQDVENPFPGERQLSLVRWGSDGPGAVHRFGLESDLELWDLLVDATRTEMGGFPRLGVRVGGKWIQALEVDPDTGQAGLIDPGDLLTPSFSGPFSGVSTIAGAFGSRTVLGFDDEGELHSFLASTFSRQVEIPSLADVDRPDLPPAGPAAPGVIDGVPVFLVPYGDAAALHLIASDGEALYGGPVAGVHCESVTVPRTTDGQDVGELGFACLDGGNLRLGKITASEIPEQPDP